MIDTSIGTHPVQVCNTLAIFYLLLNFTNNIIPALVFKDVILLRGIHSVRCDDKRVRVGIILQGDTVLPDVNVGDLVFRGHVRGHRAEELAAKAVPYRTEHLRSAGTTTNPVVPYKYEV